MANREEEILVKLITRWSERYEKLGDTIMHLEEEVAVNKLQREFLCDVAGETPPTSPHHAMLEKEYEATKKALDDATAALKDAKTEQKYVQGIVQRIKNP